MRVNSFSQSGTLNNTGTAQGLSVTMTGALILAGNPTGPLEATPKQYVDNSINSLNAANIKTGVLAAARLPAYTGDAVSVTGSGVFNLNNTTVVAGTYTKVTVDSKGRVLAGSNITNEDIPPFSWSKIINNKPVTLAGYGIADGLSKAGATVTGSLTLNNDPTSALHAATKQYVDGLTGNGATINTGTIIRRPINVTPAGFLRCNGGVVSRSTYSALFAVVKEPYAIKTSVDYTNYSAIGSGQPWRQQYDLNPVQTGNLNNWVVEGNVPSTRHQCSAIVTKNKVYLLGGYGGSGSGFNHSLVADIGSDGGIDAWSAGPNLPGNLYQAQAIVTKNRAYLIGGIYNGGLSKTVLTAVINSDGTLGTWTNSNNDLPNGLRLSSVVVTKNRVYMLGGYAVNAETAIVYTAPINADGTLGAWTTSANISVAVYGATSVVTKNRVYLLGGEIIGSGPQQTVQTAVINNDGTLGAWSTTTVMPTNGSHGQAVVVKNRLYYMPSNGYTYTNALNADGTLGNWTGSATAINTGFAQVIVTKSKIYQLANSYNTTTYSTSITSGLNDYSLAYNGTINKFDGSDITGVINNVDGYDDAFIFTSQPGNGKPWINQHQINSSQSGDITNWTLSPNPLPVTGKGCFFVTKDKVYCVGIFNGAYTAATYVASINADGTLGTWSNANKNLPRVTSDSSIVVTKNRVYLIGGNAADSVYGYANDYCYTSAINADGTLAGWESANALPEACSRGDAFVTKDRVYYVSTVRSTENGFGSSTIYTAPIDADGTLGNWAGAGDYINTFQYGDIFVVGNYAYSYESGASYLARAPIKTDGTLGPWVMTVIPKPTLSASRAFVTKNRVYFIGNGNADANVYSYPINPDGSLGTVVAGTPLPVRTGDAGVVVVKNKVYMIAGVNSGGYTNNIYSADIAGGVNDYSPYYNGSILPLNNTQFSLPDLSSLESGNDYYFVKM